ncbi:glucans biosynthesis glucosyltransferase MdoH [Acetobacteraceae bacterium B3987]|nr:glucans biosynthesis glucosyltransferase MdoH [Acetobacteraceae bacterium B3987]
MSSSERQNWEAVCKKRVFLGRILSLMLVTLLGLGTAAFLVLYNYSLYVIVPFLVCYIALSYLGATYIVGVWFGIFASLKPLEKDKYNPIHKARALSKDTLTAIIMPVYHEDIRRVSAAICAMAEDLQSIAQHEQFHFFVLSDSRNIDLVSQELYAIEKIKEMYPTTTIIYRHRIYNGDAKIGNISDFIKRFSPSYKYMLMLDADSVVPAHSIDLMARTMEGNDNIGIVQADLSMVMRNTLYSRISKFISSISLAVGSFRQYFFYMGNSYYYGHNAIIRVQAFAKHCSLPILKRKGPWGAGRPLSHDYVEAALLGSAGYEIWSLPQIQSFEELPTNFIDDFQREMRWMYGSMTYLRVLFLRGIKPFHKVRLFTSAITYINPLFGWIFLLLSSFGIIYIFKHPLKSLIIMTKFKFIFGFMIFFLIFSIVSHGIIYLTYIHKTRKSYLFGGMSKAIISYVFCVIYSIFVSPLYMCQLTKMLLCWAISKKLHWGTQNRDDRSLEWSEAFSLTGWMVLLGIILCYIINNVIFSYYTPHVQKILRIGKLPFMIFYIPLVCGMILSPLIVKFTSSHNDLIRRKNIFVSPQEVEPAFVVSRTEELVKMFYKIVPPSIDFTFLIKSPWFFHRYFDKLASRPHKTKFWLRKIKGKNVEDLTQREKYVVLRTRELWEKFHVENME